MICQLSGAAQGWMSQGLWIGEDLDNVQGTGEGRDASTAVELRLREAQSSLSMTAFVRRDE